MLLETLHDLETRWASLSAQLSLWTRNLTTRANLIDKQLALLPDLQWTWTKTREAAQGSDTPLEIRQRIDRVLAAIVQTESTLQKRRATLSWACFLRAGVRALLGETPGCQVDG
ncbi:MAG TPA: hypothetical protein VH207_07255 [Chthoniobacterales bacterium]|nr:hypothetical protein [Chthoniobacterales bacterium]